MTDLWTRPRRDETKAYNSGSEAVDVDFDLLDSATIVSLCAVFESAPTAADENMVITLKNDSDRTVMSHCFNPKDDGGVAHSKAFTSWRLAGPGKINVTFLNSDAELRELTLTWEYDQK